MKTKHIANEQTSATGISHGGLEQAGTHGHSQPSSSGHATPTALLKQASETGTIRGCDYGHSH